MLCLGATVSGGPDCTKTKGSGVEFQGQKFLLSKSLI